MNSLMPMTPAARPTLHALCAQVDTLFAAHRAPGRVTGGEWGEKEVVLNFELEPQIYNPRAVIAAALPAASAALGVPVTVITQRGRAVRLAVPLAVRKYAR